MIGGQAVERADQLRALLGSDTFAQAEIDNVQDRGGPASKKLSDLDREAFEVRGKGKVSLVARLR